MIFHLPHCSSQFQSEQMIRRESCLDRMVAGCTNTTGKKAGSARNFSFLTVVCRCSASCRILCRRLTAPVAQPKFAGLLTDRKSEDQALAIRDGHLTCCDHSAGRRPTRRWRLGWIGLAILFEVVSSAFRPVAAEEVVVLTSFPPSFFEPFHKEFEARYPGVEVTMLQRNTARSVRMLQSGDQLAADVFWASAPDAFEVLKAGGLLARIEPRATGAPATMLGHHINDKDGYYLGFALSGYGLIVSHAVV